MSRLLAGLPVEVLGRMRTNRVMRKPVPAPWISPPRGGRPSKRSKEFRFTKPEIWGEPDAATTQVTDRYGTARAMAWDRIRPRLTTRSAWIDHTGELPVIEGTLIASKSTPSPAAEIHCDSGCGRRPHPALAHPGPGPPRVSEPPPAPALSGAYTETLNTRTRKATRIQESPPHGPLWRREDDQTPRECHRARQPQRLKHKLS
jgi:hypothetical protein